MPLDLYFAYEAYEATPPQTYILAPALSRQLIHLLVDNMCVLVFFTLQEVVLEAPSHSGGQPVAGSTTVLLRCAIAYGFRNIQSLMRKIKAGKCEYDYVEVTVLSPLL